VIHAFAIEPRVAASWSDRLELRFVRDKFGLGTPRVLLELPTFRKWKEAVYEAAVERDLKQEDWLRLEELFKLFSQHRCRRQDSLYDDVLGWLENAEREHDRQAFRAIVASENPRRRSEVVIANDIGSSKARLWACEAGSTPPRTPEGVAEALSAMLGNCKALHLVDPYFHPETARHRKMLEAILEVVVAHGLQPDVIRVHCGMKAGPDFFEPEAAKMAARLPAGVSVEFRRWKQRAGGEKLHNRYVLTDLGGVALGTGLDEGAEGETDDVLLLPRAQYELRWSQYVGAAGAFELVDAPKAVTGSRQLRTARARGDKA
jgi:hypothetical protein